MSGTACCTGCDNGRQRPTARSDPRTADGHHSAWHQRPRRGAAGTRRRAGPSGCRAGLGARRIRPGPGARHRRCGPACRPVRGASHAVVRGRRRGAGHDDQRCGTHPEHGGCRATDPRCRRRSDRRSGAHRGHSPPGRLPRCGLGHHDGNGRGAVRCGAAARRSAGRLVATGSPRAARTGAAGGGALRCVGYPGSPVAAGWT